MATGIYINPMDIAGYTFWADYKYDTGFDEAVETCWYWQLGYWITEDIFATIKTCNGASTAVFTSPVKRLKTLNYVQSIGGGMPGSRGGGGGNTGGDVPKYVVSGSDAMVTPCTDRLSGDEFHVIHFHLSVIVQSQYVMDFIQALCSAKEHRFKGFDGQQPEQRLQHNQISVLQIQTIPVVRRDVTHRLYRYGEEAVVELDLICEYLLQKDGYEEVIPPMIKDIFEEES
jgi:hypothetical protein